MRIHEVEIYSSKQIYAFIKYLEVLAEEKKAIEDMQSHYSNANMLAASNCIGSLGAAQATPEYYAKMAAQRAADQACQQPDEKAEVN